MMLNGSWWSISSLIRRGEIARPCFQCCNARNFINPKAFDKPPHSHWPVQRVKYGEMFCPHIQPGCVRWMHVSCTRRWVFGSSVSPFVWSSMFTGSAGQFEEKPSSCSCYSWPMAVYGSPPISTLVEKWRPLQANKRGAWVPLLNSHMNQADPIHSPQVPVWIGSTGLSSSWVYTWFNGQTFHDFMIIFWIGFLITHIHFLKS